jgi:hypothetical protein
LKHLLTICAFCLCPAKVDARATSSESASTSIRSAIGSILQADGPKARLSLQAIPDSDLNRKDATFRACALARLDGPALEAAVISPATHKPDKFTQRLVTIYRRYWRDAAANPEKRSDLEKTLLADLNGLLGRAFATIDATEPLMAARLRHRGFHMMKGRTGYLQELMVWAHEDKKVHTVALPEESNATTVFYMDKFVSLGWSNYLTCDRSGTGGWTDEHGLHVVVPNYTSLTDENFRVNFLAHESQHFADKRRYKTIKDWELEYRAKLVELAYAVATKDAILSRFESSQSDDPAEPHSYANRQLLKAMRARLRLTPDEKLSAVPVSALHEAAIAELRADTARRPISGA